MSVKSLAMIREALVTNPKDITVMYRLLFLSLGTQQISLERKGNVLNYLTRLVTWAM